MVLKSEQEMVDILDVYHDQYVPKVPAMEDVGSDEQIKHDFYNIGIGM